MEFAFRNRDEKLPRLYKQCVNRLPRSKEEIFDHLVEHRMNEDYDAWYYHGESLHALGVTITLNVNQGVENDYPNDDVDDDMMDILCDIFGVSSHNNNENVDQDERLEVNLGHLMLKMIMHIMI